MEQAAPRPRQVTLAGWLIILGSVFLVLTVWQQISGLHTVDTREAVERVVDEPPFESLGLDVETVLGWIRVLGMVSAACATATAILGWQVLQRSKSARLAATVLAVPLFLSGFGSGVFLSTAVAAAIVWLWLSPAREWFDGVWKPTEPERRTEPDRPSPPTELPAPQPTSQPTSQPAAEPTAPQAPATPPPYPGWPAAAPAAGPTPFPVSTAPVQPAPPSGFEPAPARRPRAVLGAAVLTWVFSFVVAGAFLVGVVALAQDPDRIMDQLNEQDPDLVREAGLTVDLVRATLAVMGVIVAGWALTACVLAVFTVLGRNWARILLVVSASGAGGMLVLAAIAGAYLVVPAFACAATVGLLLRRDVSAWFRARR